MFGKHFVLIFHRFKWPVFVDFQMYKFKRMRILFVAIVCLQRIDYDTSIKILLNLYYRLGELLILRNNITCPSHKTYLILSSIITDRTLVLYLTITSASNFELISDKRFESLLTYLQRASTIAIPN